MANLILGLILTIMVIVSLRAIRKPHTVLYIDEMIAKDTPRRSWGVLPFVIVLVAVVLTLRFFFGA